MTGLDFRLICDNLADAVVAADGAQRILYINPSAEQLLGWSSAELIGQALTTIVPPRLREAHLAGFERYLTTGETKLLGRPTRVPALRRDGSEVEIELTLSAAPNDGSPAVVLALLHDLRQRVELERQLTVTRYLRATTRAAAALGSRLELGPVLETVVATLVADFDATLARVWLFEPETNTLVLRASAGLSTATTSSTRSRLDVMTDPSKVAEVARTWQPLVQNGLAGDPRFDQEWVAREGLTAMVVLPLLIGGRLQGILVHFTTKDLPDEVVEALTTFAAIVAATVNDVRLFAREQIARREAEEQRQRLQTILDVLPSGVALVEGPEGRVTVLNPAGRAIWGDKINPRQLDDFDQCLPLFWMDGQPIAKEDRPLWRALRLGERTSELARYHRPDGADAVLEVITAPFPGPLGGAISTYRDVTEQLRSEADRAERTAQLKALLDHLPVGVAYFDTIGVCRACNGPAQEYLGRSRREIIGSSAEDLFACADNLRDALLRCVRDREPHAQTSIPWPGPTVDEATRFLDWRFEPLPSDPSKPRGALALLVDVTDRTLAGVELQRSRDAAEQASKHKTQFLSAVSHDLRTPVNALSLQAELLTRLVAVRDDPDAELSELADEIRQAAGNLIELINDLLDLARFDSGQVEHHLTTFALDEWLVSTLAPLEIMARAKQIDFQCRVDQAGRLVRADRVKLGRVLVNLAGNAVKFTDIGSVVVHAGATPEGWLALAVRDTGPGIPADQRERIFDEFAQLRNPERDRTKGTGLGLAICRRLVDSVGGRLTVESRPGFGSTFTALFPPDHLPAGIVLEPIPSTEPTEPNPIADAPVLLVEDDAQSRNALARLLIHAGYAVETAQDGYEALASLERVRPALVLLDLMMPGMDGVEVLDRIRANPDHCDLPVIVLSGDVNGRRTGELRALDVSGLLAKPVDFDELIAVVSRHTSPRRAAS
ncbi:MAG: PAS domain S-box protein [Isosphaeraceae bacterium]